MNPEQLVIFDYSGTLSLASVLFGRPDNLMVQLKESGLYDLGIKNLDFFWREIVAPTWEEGSTTGIGYAGMIEKRLRERFPDSNRDDRKTRAAAARFVRSYLDNSAPDPAWIPLLRRLTSRRETAVIIATDHYAEATAAILRFLERLNVPAIPAPAAFQNPGAWNRLVVANSADLGFPKGDRRFWEKLKDKLCLETVKRLLYVDDFGFNEEKSDPYSALEKVEARKNLTISILEKVFSGEVRILPFLLPGHEAWASRRDRHSIYDELILRTAEGVANWAASA